MRIRLNGEARELPAGATLADAAREAGVGEGGRGVAVALDGEVVPRDEWAATPLRDGQAVEVLAAIQGGAGGATDPALVSSRSDAAFGSSRRARR